MLLPLALLIGLQATTPAPAGPTVAAASAFVTDIARSETAADKALADLRSSLVFGLRTVDRDRVQAAFTENATGTLPSRASGRPVQDVPLAIRDQPGTELELLEAESLVDTLFQWSQPWIEVQRASLKFHGFRLAEDGLSAVADAHLRLAGSGPEGHREELVGTLRLELTFDEAWRASYFEWVEGHSVASDTLPFREVASWVGLGFELSQSAEALNRAFIDERRLLTVGGISTLDWNQDGHPDLLATRRDQETVLFVNDGAGGFRREDLPLDLPDEASFVLLYQDFDGDGLEELLAGTVNEAGPHDATLTLYTRSTETGAGPDWIRSEQAFPFKRAAGEASLVVQTLTPADIDRDGDLDLFMGVHSDARSGGAKYNSFAAHDGGTNRLFINHGGLVFTEEAAERGLTGSQYTYVAQWFDFDGDGHLDLFEGNDYGPNWLYRGNGTGSFVRDAGSPLSGVSSYTMGLSLADPHNEGAWHLHLSNMYSHAGNRIAPLATALGDDMRQRVQALGRGNQIYSSSDGTWSDLGSAPGVEVSGWAWASLFLDFDNDGDRDLFVTNGNTSNSDPEAPDW